MNLLMDTHVLVWALLDQGKLTSCVKEALLDEDICEAIEQQCVILTKDRQIGQYPIKTIW